MVAGYGLPSASRKKVEGRKMQRKTYHNVVKAGRLIQKKDYSEKESLEMAVKIFDNMEIMQNGMPAEWFIDKIIKKT